MRRISAILLTLMMSIFIFGCSSDGNTVSAEDAVANVGSTRTVCDKVADVRTDPVSDGPLYLDLVRPAPDQVMTVVITDGSAASGLRYLAQQVCVTGVVEATATRPRVVVDTPSKVFVYNTKIPQLTASEARDGRGQALTVCDQITDYREVPDSELLGEMAMGGPLPAAPVLISLTDRRQLPEARLYRGKKVCVTGFLSEDGDRTKIVVRDPRQVWVA